AEQVDKLPEGGIVGGQGFGLEALKGELVVALVVEPDFPQVGDQVPIAGKIDGIAQGLVHGRQPSPGKGTVQRVAGALAFENGDKLSRIVAGGKPAQSGVGKLAVDLDQGFPLEGVDGDPSNRAAVAEQVDEQVRMNSGSSSVSLKWSAS